MALIALQIGPEGFAACQVAEEVEEADIRRIPIPPEDPWQACVELVREVAAGAEPTALGIACSGPIDLVAGVVAPPEIPQWRTGFDLMKAVSAAFPGAPAQLALDGVCLALAERALGATTNAGDSVALWAGDRIVGGVMVGSFAVVGRTGNAGNIGHLLVPGFDEPCACGGHGCLEAVAGGRSLRRWARARGWRGESTADLVLAAEHGDTAAVAALERAGTALGRAAASVAAVLDIDRVVVAGPLAAAGRPLWKPLNAAVAEHARLGFLTGLRCVPSQLGEIGMLIGASVLALTAEPEQ
ncbi:ROK family protein [Nocardia yamanashiensis]|uniref:ROK family protein n=1 Tax=Nocardia yamanashiensis TaxID=209247 RepID=UPI00083619F6|nr:ROK family protein [Nocardia yamanashiensis]